MNINELLKIGGITSSDIKADIKEDFNLFNSGEIGKTQFLENVISKCGLTHRSIIKTGFSDSDTTAEILMNNEPNIVLHVQTILKEK